MKWNIQYKLNSHVKGFEVGRIGGGRQEGSSSEKWICSVTEVWDKEKHTHAWRGWWMERGRVNPDNPTRHRLNYNLLQYYFQLLSLHVCPSLGFQWNYKHVWKSEHMWGNNTVNWNVTEPGGLVSVVSYWASQLIQHFKSVMDHIGKRGRCDWLLRGEERTRLTVFTFPCWMMKTEYPHLRLTQVLNVQYMLGLSSA